MTRQRAAILEVIRSDKCHHTADEIFELARLKLPTLSRATVYNNLHSLEQERIIRRISGEGTKARYDSAYEPHGHLFCSKCGLVYDFTLPDFEGAIALASDAVIDSYELKACGICPQCKKNGKRCLKNQIKAIIKQ